ncbi:ABC transporter permease [Sanguibacter sp. A247]|uniref:ABC transporter permease n=1 Tax=unclassified Sanguibacter TaxID=2645534 RepID=UPI003FD86D3D
MFLALRELSFARGRFTLMGTVVALIGTLVVLLSGLSTGLVRDGVSGLQKLDVAAFAFEGDVDTTAAFTRSTVAVDDVAAWKQRPEVADAAPFGLALVNSRTDANVDVDLALFGIDLASWLAPSVATGSPLAGPGEIVLSGTLADDGVSIGDVVTLEQTGTTLTVVGLLDGQHTFGHVSVGYVDLGTWQQIAAGVRPGETAPAHASEHVTAIALRGDGLDADALAAGDAALGTTSLTLTTSFGASPGFTAETSTLTLIQAFLYAISALVIGAFFTVVTIQRTHEIAVLRAMGASTRYLLRDSLAQSAILLLASTTVGVGVGLLLGAGLASTSMPFGLELRAVALASGLTILLGMIGAAVAVLRITRVDPLNALGGNR